MRIRHAIAGLAAAAVASLGLVGTSPSLAEAAPPPVAPAAISGCSTWITTYPGFLGVTIYRGHLTCYGTPPKGKKEYRSKIRCTFLGQTWHTRYGGWKKWGSGKDSYNSCSFPAGIASKSDISIQLR